MKKEILQNAWILINDLGEQEKQMFFDHYKNNENVFILYNIGNLEYKIINIDKEKIYLQFVGNIYK